MVFIALLGFPKLVCYSWDLLSESLVCDFIHDMMVQYIGVS